MIDAKSLVNVSFPSRAFWAHPSHRPGNRRRKTLRAIAIGAALLWAGEAQARTCTDLYKSIKSQAMYCGFFCDLETLKPLQEAYKASCIRVVLPLSPFDLDSIPQESAVLAGHLQTGVEFDAQPSPASNP